MAKYTGNSLTNLGKDLLARAIVSGEIITFTKVELGKGTAIENNEELEGLVDTFKILPITSTSKLEGGTYRVRVAFDNTGITEDKELREIGVFARGEDGEELLYSYCHTDTPDLIPAEGSGVVERVEDVITFIANAANVNAVIDQSKVYATIKDLTEGLAEKEDKFDKNSAFNLDKTDSAETNSSILLATAKAVKKAWDKAMEALGFTNTNKAAILNNTEQIENLYTPSTLFNSPVTGKTKELDIPQDIKRISVHVCADPNYMNEYKTVEVNVAQSSYGNSLYKAGEIAGVVNIAWSSPTRLKVFTWSHKPDFTLVKVLGYTI